MKQTAFDYKGEIAWCPGCGDYKILEALKEALDEMGLSPQNVVVASGIGQGAKMPHYMNVNIANGLHGRALPLATGIKAASPELVVIAVGGDGDMYGEGGNHFIHAIRRNPDITNIVCNNMIYGLTKGQASPTTARGIVTTAQPQGVRALPFNPLFAALACGATFVARGSAADVPRTKELIKAAISHKGYSLIDIFQPCVSFNRVNTWSWLQNATEWIPEDRAASDLTEALELAQRGEPYPLGIIYRAKPQESFEAGLAPYRSGDMTPLHARPAYSDTAKKLLHG